jgi:hypothetical protein
MTPEQRAGRQLFMSVRACCLIASPAFMTTMTRERLSAVIRDGLPGASMPAWKSVRADDDIPALAAYIARAFHPLAAGIPVAGILATVSEYIHSVSPVLIFRNRATASRIPTTTSHLAQNP